MAYEIKRTRQINSSVKIGDGEVPVKIDIATQGNDFNTKYAAAVNAEIAVKRCLGHTDTPEDLKAAEDTYGQAILALMRLIFGDDGTEQLVAYFDGNYAELLEALIPFFLDELIPELSRLRDQRAQIFARAAGMSKKQGKRWGR